MDDNVMTKEEAMRAINEAQSHDDNELAHLNADNALCAFLRHLGHADLVDAWDKVVKWYS